MQPTKIDYADFSWNPIRGCTAGCPYCFARAMAPRLGGDFRPQVFPEKLWEPMYRKKPTRIFACTMGDLFDPGFTKEVRQDISDVMTAAPQHTFLLLTKKPQNIDVVFPPNVWCGVTVDYPSTIWRITRLLQSNAAANHFVSFEPLLGDMVAGIDQTPLDLKGIDWIIVGRCTGRQAAKYPTKREWVVQLERHAHARRIPVFIKDNLKDQMILKQYPVW
jgi:protein gp37